MRQSTGHTVATTCLTVLGIFAGPALAGPPEQDTVPVVQHVTADEARALQGEGRWEEAAEAWGEVAEQQPDDGTAWFNLGYCLHAAGRLEEAIKVHKKAATFDDYHGIAMYNLGCAYALVGRPDDAVEALAQSQDAGFRLRGRVESDSDLQSLMGNPDLEALLQRERASGWRGKVEHLVAGAKQFLTGPQMTGMMQKMQGMLAQLQQKMAGDERFAALAQRLQAWLGGGQADAAAQAEAHAEPPQEPAPAEHGEPAGDTATLERARGFQQVADWGNAVDAYRAVLIDEPDSVAAWFGLAYCLHMSGEYEEAITAHKESAKFDQTRGIALYNLACAYALTGRPDKAMEALNKSREAGFDIASARSDSDFDSIREDPRFKEVLSR